ncbi:ParB/RepB/Spo0J family partition protein [Halotalea alkalilenta]|uniref:ParB/RepB/Spo0J family partition protein n=1 Tax=Halotalea alkalilenta TaxID=376489 RepID=UPI000480D0F4|nr:ParB/RepB/Spo0J family partition protein [Halotalea alkalilenta]
MTRKRALGRGLDALIGARGRSRTPLDEVSVDERHADPAEAPADVSPRSAEEHAERLLRLELGALSRGRYQPRREFDRERLDELAASIKHRGVMQPIVVRPLAGKGERQRYEIIAGERRWRAAQLAGLEVIPAVVRELDDESALALALIENIQREDLSAIDEALALKRLIDEFALTQQQVAEAVGKSRAQVANLLRLLALEAEVQGMLERGELDVGHARALLPLKGARQRHAARDVVARGLTVRQTESMVRRLLSPPAKESRSTADVAQLENRLGELLGAAVKIDHGASGKGKVLIKYSSLDELDGILAHIR